jgi:hypothetical protein
MYVKLIDIEGLRLRGPEGDIGRLQDFLVDERWVVRYLVVSTGAWLGRAVVASPLAITGLDWADGRIDVWMRRDQIRSSPDLLDVRPLTRSAEAAYAAHYGIPIYWGGSGIWASAGFPGALVNAPPVATPPADGPHERRSRCISCRRCAAVISPHAMARSVTSTTSSPMTRAGPFRSPWSTPPTSSAADTWSSQLRGCGRATGLWAT